MVAKTKNKGPVGQFFRAFSLTLLICTIFAVAALAILLSSYVMEALAFNIKDYSLNLSSFIYYTDKSGKSQMYDTLYANENRVWVNFESIPQNLKDAFVDIEDERFYAHRGIDLKRTSGALFNFIFKGDSDYGGSTITQQLIKNLTGDKESSPDRKVREIFRSLTLESQLSKDEILEFYLNTIYLGHGCNGVQAASHMYFGKDVSKLNLAECASIAGITQLPTKYDPIINPESNKYKQELVLKKMKDLEHVDEKEYDQAVNYKLKLVNDGKSEALGSQSYFVDAMIDEIAKDLAKEKKISEKLARKMLYSGGLKIYSTIDPDIQTSIENVFTNSSNFPKLNGSVQPQASMIVIDPYSGAIKGVVGGIGAKSGDFTLNRATGTLRQPGSTIKPISVYGPAVENKLVTPSTTVVDEPIDIAGWKPNNYDNSFKGPVSVRYAIQDSRNVPAVKVAQMVGVNQCYKQLTEKLGITSIVKNEKRSDGSVYSDVNLSGMALGGLTYGVSVKEMTAAYQPFVNGGIYYKPYTYTKVVDKDGKTVLTNKKDYKIALNEQTAYIMNNMLVSVVKGRMGAPAQLENMTTGGKTGTTSDNKDRWFIGFNPYYLAGFWYGYDSPQTLPQSTTGISLRIWKKVMDGIDSKLNLENKDFSVPKDIEEVSVCTVSGKLATSNCPSTTEAFISGTEPNSRCTIAHTRKHTEATPSQDTEQPSQQHNEPAPDNTNAPPVPSSTSVATPKPFFNKPTSTPKPQ